VSEENNVRVLRAPPENRTAFNLFDLCRCSENTSCDVASETNNVAAGIEIFGGGFTAN
jgi:hypothetical protein